MIDKKVNKMKTKKVNTSGRIVKIDTSNLDFNVRREEDEIELFIPMEYDEAVDIQINDLVSNIKVDGIMEESLNIKIREFIEDAVVLNAIQSRIKTGR
jgi:hypothetical protein